MEVPSTQENMTLLFAGKHYFLRRMYSCLVETPLSANDRQVSACLSIIKLVLYFRPVLSTIRAPYATLSPSTHYTIFVDHRNNNVTPHKE